MNRPIGVWLVTVYCVLNAIMGVMGLYMLASGKLPPMSEQQANFFAHHHIFDYAISTVFHGCIAIGGIFLFMLRKQALQFFVAGAGFNLIQMIWRIFTHRFMTGVIVPRPMAWIALILAWGIILAVIFYTARLSKRGVLT